jgi:hypothetical protein
MRCLMACSASGGLVTHYTLWASSDWTNWTKLAEGERMRYSDIEVKFASAQGNFTIGMK